MTPYTKDQIIFWFWVVVGYAAIWLLFASIGILSGCYSIHHQPHPKMTPWTPCIKDEIRQDGGYVYRCLGWGAGWEIVGEEPK